MKHIRVGCGALIIEDDKVLLVKRSKKSRSQPGLWARPGGEVEFGESLSDAVKREVLEEIGIKIIDLEFFDMSEHYEQDSHWIALGFLIKEYEGTPENKEPDKHDEVKWFPLNDLPELAVYTEVAIKKYLNQ